MVIVFPRTRGHPGWDRHKLERLIGFADVAYAAAEAPAPHVGT